MPRDKFFFVAPQLFKDYEFKDRRAIGLNLNDGYFRNKQTYRFEIAGITYEIDKQAAEYWGRKYDMGPAYALRHLIPISAFKAILPIKVWHDTARASANALF